MNKNNKNIIFVLAGGFFVAILVALMVQAALNTNSSDTSQDTVQILVAAKPLKTGHRIVEGDFMWKKWPEDSVFEGSIIKEGDTPVLEIVSGRMLRPISKDQPVHKKVVSSSRSGNFLAIKIEDGKRAVGIAVKSSALAERLIKPGDFVDVILTHKLQINPRENPDAKQVVNRYATETIVQNIRVLAVDNVETSGVDEEEEGGVKNKKTSRSATVTLEATPRDAEYLNLASRLGDIGLALRSIGDDVIIETDTVTTDIDMSNVLTKLSTMKKTSSGVRVYSGADMEEVEARNPAPAGGVSFEVEQAPQPNNTIVLDPALVGGPDNE